MSLLLSIFLLSMPSNDLKSKTLANLNSRGIGYEIIQEAVLDASGQPVYDKKGNPITKDRIVIKSIPASEAELNRFYSLDIPCWFNGCEELRKEYKAELDKANPTGCTDCQKGAIMRLFEDRIRLAIKNSKHAQQTTPRITEVSRPDEPSNEGTGESTSLLRRASEGLKKVFGLS